METDGLVSTIIPVFNRASLLREAVESVLHQDYRPIEIIIVDDGSTDETGRVADDLAQAFPNEIRAIHVENGGPGAAREAGRVDARGEFLQYLDSDDVLLAGKFRRQVGALRANPECDVAYGMTRFRHADGRLEQGPWKRSGERIETMFPAFLCSRWWETATPLYRRSVCDVVGPWLTTSHEEDWEYDCRVAAAGGRLCYVPDYVCEHRDHKGGRLSRGGRSDKQKMQDRATVQQRIFQAARSAGIGPEVPEMQHFARALFLLARQCGAAGLAEEAKSLFELARAASGERRGRGLDFRLYGMLTQAIGWSNAGRLACRLDRLRP